MKIAFVHDRIVYEWWAEVVLRHLIESRNFDEWKIFVLFSTRTQFQISNHELQDNNNSLSIVNALPTRLNNIFVYFNTCNTPILSKVFDYRNLMFWFPILTHILRKKIERYEADEVIISSFAAVKNVVSTTKKNSDTGDSSLRSEWLRLSKVTLYLHSPMQYIRENYEENVKKLSFPIKQLYQFASTYLRPRDKKYRRYDVVLCNSNYTAKLAKQLYGLEWIVEYPQVDNAFVNEPISDKEKDYFVFVWRVQKYVREIWIVIDACNQTNTPLIVLWDGPDMDYAKSIAWPTIIFVWRIDSVEEKVAIIKHAKWLINIAKESFGIGTAEALCLWVPCLGYNWWATPELIDESNWVLVDDKSKLVEWIEAFCSREFNRKEISENARKMFS